MSEKTNISWCDSTHNFWQGCTKVSPGCAHCYAETRDKRFSVGAHWGKGAPRVRSKDFEAPLRWNEKPWVCNECGQNLNAIADDRFRAEPAGTVICGKCHNIGFHGRRVFSLSLGDWLDDEVPIEWLADMLDVIQRCRNLDFLLLTKRPENFGKRLVSVFTHLTGPHVHCSGETEMWVRNWQRNGVAPRNVWIGTTCEDQQRADERIPELLKIPAVCRFVSYEPALGPVDFTDIVQGSLDKPGGEHHINALSLEDGCVEDDEDFHGALINWIIIGGESGPGARPFNIEWARSTIAQSRAAGVACFVKQLGSFPVTDEATLDAWPIGTELQEGCLENLQLVRLNDKKGGDPAEWPSDLRVREFPNVEAAR